MHGKIFQYYWRFLSTEKKTHISGSSISSASYDYRPPSLSFFPQISHLPEPLIIYLYNAHFHSTYLSHPVCADAIATSNSFCVAPSLNLIGHLSMTVFSSFITSPAFRLISLNRSSLIYLSNSASKSQNMSWALRHLSTSAEYGRRWIRVEKDMGR